MPVVLWDEQPQLWTQQLHSGNHISLRGQETEENRHSSAIFSLEMVECFRRQVIDALVIVNTKWESKLKLLKIPKCGIYNYGR